MKETKSLEFKSTITNTFLKTVSAYSNFGDGEVWFGVNDDGTVCGVPDIEQVLEGSNLSFEEIAYGEKDLAFEELSKKLIPIFPVTASALRISLKNLKPTELPWKRQGKKQSACVSNTRRSRKKPRQI